MKYYKCDKCEKEIITPEVTLTGVIGTSGGILLPEQLHKKHFCSSECFWEWIKKYNPSD